MLKLKKVIAVFTAVLFIANAVGFADMIEIDGKTQTTINQSGNTYDVSTKTILGDTGFNSFKKFDVDKDATVNLRLADNMANLVNLVSDKKTNIYGTLNSFKNGKIAGNVFFLNPNGIVIGETGVVNVGALTLATPTKEFLENVINSDKQVSSILTKAILAGDMPINETGTISIKGKINAFNGVGINANKVEIDEKGKINTRYSVDDIVNFGDVEDTVVRVKDGKVVVEAIDKVVDSGEIHTWNTSSNGDVEITANEVELDGAVMQYVENVKIKGTQSVEMTNETDINAEGAIDIQAQNVTLKNSELISNENIKLKGTDRLEINDGSYIEAEDLAVIESQNASLKKSDIHSYGNVKLIGSETLEINDNASIKAHTVSIEAKNLTLGSNTIEADNTLGTTNTSIVTDNITVTENQNLNTNYILDATDKITVNENISIKTNGNNIVLIGDKICIKNNASLDTALSNDVAGGIFMEAKTLTIEDNVSLNANVTNDPSMGGNIVLLAKNTNKGYWVYETKSKIDIGKNVNINAKNILISAVSSTERLFEPENDDNAVEEIAKTIGNYTLGFISDYSLFGAYLNVDVEAILNIGKGTIISATENLDIISSVTSKAVMSVYGTAVAVVYGVSEFTCKLNIDNNVQLSGNNVNISALTNSNFGVSATTISTAATPESAFDVSLAIGKLDGNTTLDIKDGTVIIAQENASVKAQTDKIFYISSSASAFQGGVVGTAITYGHSDVTNSVDFNGQITAQNINVESIINAKKDRIVSSTGTGDTAVTKFLIGTAMNGAIDAIKGKFTKVKTASSSNIAFSFTGAVTYNENTNTSKVNLGENSTITSLQDTNINSNITQENFRQAANAGVSSYENHKKENGASVGLSLLYNTNNTSVTAQDGATIDSNNNLNIESKYYMPFDITYFDLIGDFKNGDYTNLIKNVIDKLNGNLGIQNGFFTTWTNSSITVESKDDERLSGIGIAGAINIAFYDTESKVNLGAVNINQNTVGNNVNISALADTFALNFSGNWGLTFFADKFAKGLGASYEQMEYDTDIEATIANGAKITVNDGFLLEAKDEQMDITTSVAGGKAQTFGIEGTFNWVKVDNNTTASVGNATINILNNKENSESKIPSIYAMDDGLYINVAGAVLLAENIGVGVGIALTDIERNTQAYLGSDYTSGILVPTKDLNTFDSNKGLDITSLNKGAVYAYSLAATVSTQSNDKKKAKSSSGGDYGVGISGAYGETNITDNSSAYVHNAKYKGKENLNIDSQEKTKINTVSPGAAIATGQNKSGAGGVAGSVSVNNITNTAVAFISGNSNINSDNLKVNSYSDSDIFSVAASLAVAVSKGSGVGVSIAGSVSLNEIENTISSYISNSDITTSNKVEVDSKDDSNILAIAGGIDASNTVGLGSSVTENTVKNTVSSYINSSATLTIVNDIILSALNNTDIKGIAGTLGLTTAQGLAAAVSVTINEIANKTKSYIDNSKDISSTKGGVSLNSEDTSTMYSIAGGGTIALEGFALGAGAGKSIINNEIDSYISDSKISSKKDIDVKSKSGVTIQTASAGVAIAGGKFAGSGSVGINDITTTLNSKIDGSTIDTQGNTNVEATSTNDINFYGGSVAASASISGGGTLVLNTVKDKANAKINNSSIKAKDVNVKTDVDDTIEIYSVNGGGSGTGALEASVTLNSIENDSIAEITNCNSSDKKIKTTGNVSVTADNKVKTNVNGGGLAVAGSAAIGVVYETTKFTNTTKANIDNSKVEADGNVNVKTKSEQIYNAIIASGGLSANFGVAGNIASVAMECVNEAIVKDSTINSKLDVVVEADDTGTIGDGENSGDIFIVGSLGVGLEVAGVAGSVAVSNIKNNTLAKIVDSTINATKTLTVKATTDYLTQAILPAVGGGTYLGLAVVASVATIDTTTQAFIEETENKSTIINNDDNYKGNNQSVEVEAISYSKVSNVSTSGGVGAVGIGAGMNVNDIDNKTVAAIGDNTEVYAKKDISVKADNTKEVVDFVAGLAAGAAGISGSVSVSNLGSAIDFESNKETGNTKDVVNGELARVTQINFEDGESTFFENIDTDVAKYETDVSSTFNTEITKDNSTAAFIGKNAIVKSGNKVELKAEDKFVLDKTAGSASLGAVAFGASVLMSNLFSSTKAYIDTDAEVESKNILVKAVSNVDSTALSFLGAGSIYSSVGAVVSKITSKNDTLAYSNAKQLTGTEKVEIVSDATATENSQTVGVVVGAAAVGASVSIIDKSGTTSAYIGENSKVDGKDLTIKANNNFDLYAEAEAGAGGVVSGSGTVALVTVDDVINATIGKNSIINLSKVLNILTNSSIYAHTNVIGASLAGLAVGASFGEVNITLDNNVIVCDGANITADKVILASQQTKADTNVKSMAVAGALVGEVGALADSSVKGGVKTTIEDNVNINSKSGLQIESKSNSKQETQSTRYAGAVISIGANTSDITSDIDTQTEIKDDVTLNSKNIKIKSVSNNELYTNTEAGSGGIADIFATEATTNNTSDTNVIVGKATITGDSVDVLSENTTNQDSKVKTTSIGAIQGSGIAATNTSTQNVLVDFEGSQIISNKFITNAKNNFVKNKYEKSIDFTGGGFISANTNESNTEIKDTTKVVFDKYTNVTTKKDSNGNSTFIVNAYNNIKAIDFATLSSGGLVAVPSVLSKINNSVNKAIVEIAKATIKTANDLVINTKSDLDISATANLSSYGAVTVVHGNSNATSNVDNQIILKEDADVFSEGNTYLYLTKPYNDARAVTNMKAITQIWNKSALPFDADSTAEAILNINNLVDIQKNAKLKGTDTIYIEGNIPIYDISSIYDYISTYDDIASSNKVSNTQKSFYTKVNVDGELLTGINNIEDIEIRSDRQVVFGETSAEVNWNITTENLAENLIKELEKLEKLQTEYSSNEILKNAYQKDINRVKDDLRKLGLIDEYGNVVRKGKDALLDVDFITFDDIYANRGDIYIIADDLDGSGTLSAQSNAEIVIENNSDLFLRLNDVKIAGDGNGIIFYNTNSIKTKEDIEQMNTKVKTTNFDNENIISQQTKTSPVISITSNYRNEDDLATNVELLGDIENINGLVKVDALGTIYTKGNILGETIDIKTQADIVQTYTEGFRHIGGAPETQWAGVISSGKDPVSSDTQPQISETSSIIGNNVFLSGRYLNINGLVQAGIADCNLVIEDDNLSLKIGSIQDAKNDYLEKLESHDPTLTNLYQLSNKYGTTLAYYNVETDKIEVADINISGGHLELYGEIINTSLTGAGELRVLDGYSKLNIENKSSYDLVLNSINIGNNVEGVIKITDISKRGGDGNFLETIYTKLGNTIKQVDSTTRDNKGNPNNVVMIDGSTTQYNPTQNLRYKWMTGVEVLVRTTDYYEDNSFWGMDWAVKDESKKSTEIEYLQDTPLLEGSVLVTDSSNKNYNYTYDEYVLNENTVGKSQGSYSTGWWIFSVKTYWYETVKETGEKYYRTHSIKASNPININFIGYDKSQATISSINDICLNGSIKNLSGDVSIISSNGAITNNGCGSITANNITLNAKNGIGNNNDIVINLKGGILNATTDTGNINIYSKDVLTFDNITNNDGNISLNSMYDVVGKNESSLIKGNTLYIGSKLGSVGTLDNIVNMQVNELSADVTENMFVNQNGDLGLNEVNVGKELNMFVDGSIYDNNTNDFADTRTEQQMQNYWNSMDLFGEAGWNEEQLKYAINSNRFDATLKELENEQANITANKVNVVVTGSIGKEEGKKIIDMTNYSSLSAEDKQLLATVEKDDISFEYDTSGNLKSAVITLKEDVDITAKELTLKANKNIYLGSQEDININQIESGTDNTITIDSLGGIYNINIDAKPNIIGKDLIIESLGGTIGTEKNPIILSLNGKLTAKALDNIYLNSINNLAVDYIYSQGTINITTNSNDLTNANMDEYVNLNAKEINIESKNIGDNDNSIGVMLIGENSSLNIKSTGDIYINNANSNEFGNDATTLKIGNIDVANNANIKSHADILNADDNSKITANNLNFIDVKGNIGEVDDKILVDINKVSANATGSINLMYNKDNDFVLGDITSQDSDINLISKNNMVIEEMVSAQKGDVNLKIDGSITDLVSDDKASIFANNINIKANSIGSKDNCLGINTSTTEQGYLSAEIEKDINVVSPNKDLDIAKIVSKTSDISLVVDKSLNVKNLGGKKANIKANNITIKAKDGQIGSKDNFAVVDVNDEGGKVNLKATNGINLKQLGYTFNSDYIYNTNSGTVNLDLPNSNVRIKDIETKENKLNIMFRDRDNINDILLDNKNIKNLTISPVPTQLSLIDCRDNLININSILMNNYNILDSILEPVKLISFNNIGIEE